ncbi:MAG: hypothetical protein QOE90_1724 [Thermoplasmata archaeon]|nr:hypothetical protein [Thermoplasmata archaeon]
MAYDDVKVSPSGAKYVGAPIGLTHEWEYAGRWRETKLAPDRWTMAFRAMKRRHVGAPIGSGAKQDSGFYWLIVATQRARKVDANAYTTMMEGVKWKLAHKRADRAVWSHEYRGAATMRQRTILALRSTLAGLEREEALGVAERDLGQLSFSGIDLPFSEVMEG